jgi:hypothetical protein
MTDVVGQSQLTWGLGLAFLTIFGAGALLLPVGICGLVAFSVEQRHREIGVRIAIGLVLSLGLGSVAQSACKESGRSTRSRSSV